MFLRNRSLDNRSSKPFESFTLEGYTGISNLSNVDLNTMGLLK